ncbi:hypothetical protein [Halobacterium salinarum]|uniref:hypothetical protein n=1 Tax=Halobacterium salinarum TaxID=2242 RepID=UPI0032C21350
MAPTSSGPESVLDRRTVVVNELLCIRDGEGGVRERKVPSKGLLVLYRRSIDTGGSICVLGKRLVCLLDREILREVGAESGLLLSELLAKLLDPGGQFVAGGVLEEVAGLLDDE